MEFVSYGQILNAFGEEKSFDLFDLFAESVKHSPARHPISHHLMHPCNHTHM
jgi:hypothetical protein